MSTASLQQPERIEDVDITNEMSESFLEYAYSVIYSRALPDARDGLKPVQRRIIYMMGEMGLRPDKGHVKSARVVGEVMGKLHPHGDSAIYDALVRQAQPFNMRQPLVDGHGNFGSLDDGPAASRYTEARLAPAALEMLTSIDEDVVDFGPNYDNSIQQPLVLPSAFPNLLVNGASGIAVGMATNMAPHNLAEVIAGARFLLDNPDADLDQVMAFIPGPDFPSGGSLLGLEGIREAYETGRGSVKVRAKATVENVTARKKALVITELPYQVGPEKVIEAIKAGVQSKKIQGVSDLNDFTDRKNGLKLVITVKTGFSPEAVLEQLYRQTPLEDSFAFNNVCLVDGQPQTLGLIDLLRVYLDHRITVVRRRSQFRLKKREDRLHLVEGLLVAIADIDEVIQVIRSSDDAESARTRLQQIFDLSTAQAEYILELRLRRLTKFSRIELENERGQLQAEIKELKALLANGSLLKQQVSNELAAVADQFGDDRRTTLLNAKPTASKSAKANTASLEIADLPCLVLLSASGRLLRIDAPNDAESVELVTPSRRTKHDAILSRVNTTVRGQIAALTNTGRVLRFSPVDLPSAAPNSVQLAAGARTKQYLEQLQKNERVIALLDEESTTPLALGTKQGVVKRLTPGEWLKSDSFEIISLKPGDELVGAAYAADDTELIFVSSGAQLLRFSATAVRPQGRTASGMAGMKLPANTEIVAFNVVNPAITNQVVTFATGNVADPSDALFTSENVGSVKVSDLADFPAKGRATGGVRAHRFLRDETQLSGAWVGSAPVLVNGKDGSLRQLPVQQSKRDATGTPVAASYDCFGEQI